MAAEGGPAEEHQGAAETGAAQGGEVPGGGDAREQRASGSSDQAPASGTRERRRRSGARALPLSAPPAPAVRASSMDSVTLPERSRHEPGERSPRRRRSATHLPVVLAPTEVPDDATGRVEIFVVRAPADRDAPPEEEPPAGTGDEGNRDGAPPAPAARILALGSGWVAVGILAGVLAALFVLLDLLLPR